MAQYFTDFSEYSTDSFPSDWNVEYDEGVSEVKSRVDASNGMVLLSNPFYNGEHAVSWSDAGDSSNGPVQIYARVKAPTTQANVRIALCGSGDEGYRNLYALRIRVSGPSIIKYVNDSFYEIGSSYYEVSNFDSTEYYHLKLEKDGSTLRGKLWQNTAEPSWQLTVTDTSLTSGWIGTHVRSGDSGYYSDFGVGTNGDPAPMSPVTSSIPAAPTGLTLTEL